MNIISIEEAMNLKDVIYIDVRSPLEYLKSTIPGAINIPLFSNEQREKIGQLFYRNKESAYEEGFKIGTYKLYDIYKEIKALPARSTQAIILFCWRGGMRSKSIVINLNIMGINAYQLKGGYKAYRKYILDQLNSFHHPFDYYILHGNTGVGKTRLLKELEKKGEPVLDLEGLANNRGSIFGSIGLGEPVNQKMFDSWLLDKLKNNTKNYFFLESESKRIGNILLPDFLLDSIRNGVHILVKTDLEDRIQNIMDEYLPISDKDNIIDLLINNKYMEKKKGKKWIEHLIAHLIEEDYHEFIKLLLHEYYDPLYSYSENKYEPYQYVIENKDVSCSLSKLQAIAAKDQGWIL